VSKKCPKNVQIFFIQRERGPSKNITLKKYEIKNGFFFGDPPFMDLLFFIYVPYYGQKGTSYNQRRSALNGRQLKQIYSVG
jgi:hypothetical protein